MFDLKVVRYLDELVLFIVVPHVGNSLLTRRGVHRTQLVKMLSVVHSYTVL